MQVLLSNIRFSAFASHPSDTEELQCNTEKNKIKLHDRSAGSYNKFLSQTVIFYSSYNKLYSMYIASIYPLYIKL